MLRSPFAILALVAGTYALTIRSTCGCSFHLSTGGDVTGPVGEDSQGEVLEGSSLTAASFCLNGNTITDSHGNPCWFTPPTYVLQCDYGAIPAAGFSIGCNGEVSFNGQTTFYECHNGIGDEVNLYLKPDEGANCGSITLTADSCHTSCVTSTTCAASRTVTVTYTEIETVSVCPSPTTTPPPPPPPPTTCTTRSTTATTTSTKSTGTCPMELPSLYQFPHLIVPIDSSNPSTAAGTSYFGQVSSTISTIFNFDIPSSYTGQCTLWFLFPTQAELVTSSFTLSGSGSVEFFGGLDGVATQSTSFSNAPHATLNLGQFTLAPGNAYDIYTFSCPSGTAISFEMTANDDTAFKYFQDFNECPIGLYVVLN